MTIQPFGIWAVGGCTRDYLLGRDPKDLDFVVTGLNFVELLELVDTHYEVLIPKPEYHEAIRNGTFDQIDFGKKDNANKTTVDLGVIKARTAWGVVDFCLARGERDEDYPKNGIVPNTVILGPEVPLLLDLGRRDFTMNAICYKVWGIHNLHWQNWESKAYDPFGGINALRHSTISAVGDPLLRLSKDPSRIPRALKFHLRLGFNIDDYILATLANNAELLAANWKAKINRSRAEQELAKVFASSPNAYTVMKAFDLLPSVLVEAMFQNDIQLTPRLCHD